MASSLAARALFYLLSTFYSPVFYRGLLRDWRGIGFSFILFATLFNASVYGYRTYGAETMLARALKGAIERLPDASMKGGKFSISGPTPFSEEIMTLPTPPGMMAPATKLVVDPSYVTVDETVVKERMQSEQIAILITATRILIYRSPSSALETHDISGAPDNNLDHSTWLSIARAVRVLFWPLSLLINSLGIVAFQVLATLFFAVICQAFSAVFRMQLSFAGALRCAAAASVPASVIIELLLSVLWLKLAIWLGYVVFGLRSSRRPRAVQ